MKSVIVFGVIFSLAVSCVAGDLPNNSKKQTTASTKQQIKVNFPRDSTREPVINKNTETWGTLFSTPLKEATWDQYGYLVPGYLGATIFVAAGNGVGWPIKVLANMLMGNFHRSSLLPPVEFTEKYIAPIGAYGVGMLFYLLNKLFVRFPVALFK